MTWKWLKMKICKESGLEVWRYTEGLFCDQCLGEKECEVAEDDN